MKIKKILLIFMLVFMLCGCKNIKNLSYDEILNNFNIASKKANVYKKGYQFFVPSGLLIDDAGSSYAVINSSTTTYYLYVDLVSYFNNSKFNYEKDNSLVYSKKLNYNKKDGYIEIKLWENNQYLIEIMYNYAKIEVMVDKDLINDALINSISILNSVKYNDLVIERLLNDDNLSFTEEVFEMFKNDKNNSNSLEFEDVTEDLEEKDEIIDTDFIN